MEGLAEYYSAELSQKIKRGMTESALKCKYTGSGVSFGYKIDEEKKYQIDSSAAQAVETIFNMYIAGKSNVEICNFFKCTWLSYNKK